MTQYTCPVCAYQMSDPVEEGNICPCCGTEFGYDDDLDVTYQQLRNRWLENGARWFSAATSPPENWNPIVQLVLADYEFADADERQQVQRERVTGRWVDYDVQAAVA